MKIYVFGYPYPKLKKVFLENVCRYPALALNLFDQTHSKSVLGVKIQIWVQENILIKFENISLF